MTAWLAIAGAVGTVISLERRTAATEDAFRSFDELAHRASDTLSNLRVGQQAYVATGQGVGFWMPKVGATMDAAADLVAGLQRSASSAGARSAVDEAAAAITELRGVDARAREYLENMQPLMAGDVVFTEGEQTAVLALRAVQRARLAERDERDVVTSANNRLEAIAVAAAAGVAALAVLLLLPKGAATDVEPAADGQSESAATPAERNRIAPPPVQPKASSLARVAGLCTDFGRVRDIDELQRLLGRTADVMSASGVMVWLGDLAGADLKPMLAHGYPAGMIERLPGVPRAADNAAAAAYRTGALQVVLAKTGQSSGAIVAPVLTADGCIGALSAEIKDGAEVSEQNQAVAALVAAHLASVLAPTTAASQAAAPPPSGTAEGQAQAAAG